MERLKSSARYLVDENLARGEDLGALLKLRCLTSIVDLKALQPDGSYLVVYDDSHFSRSALAHFEAIGVSISLICAEAMLPKVFSWLRRLNILKIFNLFAHPEVLQVSYFKNASSVDLTDLGPGGGTGIDTGGALHSMLRHSVLRLNSTVIRPLQDGLKPRIELAVDVDAEFLNFQRSLLTQAKEVFNAFGLRKMCHYRRSGLFDVFGPLHRGQKIYAFSEGREGEPAVYLGVFPWETEKRATLVLGTMDSRAAGLHFCRVLRADLLEELGVFEHPSRAAILADSNYYDRSYRWLITEEYVGPDRRVRQTTFFNSYVFWGRRSTLLSFERGRASSFVDSLPSWVYPPAFLFLLLFGVDTAMTWSFAGSGVVLELNPLLRWSLAQHPLWFWGLKSGFWGIALFVLLRWHSWRRGRALFALALLMYTAIDFYWLWLFCTGALG